MTRLAGLMPYDFDQKADDELKMLLVELKKSFIRRVELAREKSGNIRVLESFAKYGVSEGINCITFNYDDVFDEALWKVAGASSPISSP